MCRIHKETDGKTVQYIRRLLIHTPMTMDDISAETGVAKSMVQRINVLYDVRKYERNNRMAWTVNNKLRDRDGFKEELVH